MKTNHFLFLRKLWLFTSLAFVLLPIYYSATGNNGDLRENIGLIVFAVFILSFPFSFFGLPFIIFFVISLRNQMSLPAGGYLTLLLFFACGLIQWYWALPNFASNRPEIQTLNLPDGKLAVALGEARAHAFDCEGRTPLERVIHETDRRVIRSIILMPTLAEILAPLFSS
jgi:hypothetical protein